VTSNDDPKSPVEPRSETSVIFSAPRGSVGTKAHPALVQSETAKKNKQNNRINRLRIPPASRVAERAGRVLGYTNGRAPHTTYSDSKKSGREEPFDCSNPENNETPPFERLTKGGVLAFCFCKSYGNLTITK
jgi:hypothetical protein